MAGKKPRKYNDEQVAEFKEKLAAYIDETEVPIVSEFAYQAGILREQLYQYPEFHELVRRLIDKKEAQLERLALDRKINTAMAIFSLKQMGWREKPKDEDDNGALDRLVEAIDRRLEQETDKGAKGSK